MGERIKDRSVEMMQKIDEQYFQSYIFKMLFQKEVCKDDKELMSLFGEVVSDSGY